MSIREPGVHMNFPGDSRGVQCVENRKIVGIVL